MYNNRPNAPTFLPGLTDTVKLLLIINLAVFLVVLLVPGAGVALAMVPARIVTHFTVYEFLTAVFVHFAPMHLIVNMLVLYFFGPQVERDLGRRNFIWAYLIAGVAGNLCSFLVHPMSPALTIGASGAIMGIMAIFAYRYPDAKLYLYFILPIRAWTFLLLYVGLDLVLGLAQLQQPGPLGGIAYFAHVGGAVAGLLWYKYYFLPRRFRPF